MTETRWVISVRADALNAAFPGVIAQLGERYNGIVEVAGSIPAGSTNLAKGLAGDGQALCSIAS